MLYFEKKTNFVENQKNVESWIYFGKLRILQRMCYGSHIAGCKLHYFIDPRRSFKVFVNCPLAFLIYVYLPTPSFWYDLLDLIRLDIDMPNTSANSVPFPEYWSQLRSIFLSRLWLGYYSSLRLNRFILRSYLFRGLSRLHIQ